MNIKFLYISTERFCSLLYKELDLGIASVKQNVSSINHDFISVSSITLSKSEEVKDTVDEYVTTEIFFDLTKEFTREETEETSTSDDPNLQDYYKVAESLHKFADTNCQYGNTLLYLFWCVQDFLPCPSETVEFYGALKRLHCWHNSTINIVTNNFDAVEDWVSYLPLHVIGSSVEIIKNINQNLWKGCLTFSIEGKTNVTPISQVTLFSESKNFNIFNFCGANKEGQKLFILPIAEVFSEVQLKSVPWAFVQRESLCYLSPSPDTLQKDKEHAEEILNSFTHNDEVGVLFRIRYSFMPPLLQGVKALDTEHWKQTIAEGNLDLHPSSSFQNRHETMVFLMLSKDHKNGLVNCVALLDPNSYGEDIVKMILQDQLQDKVLETENNYKIRDLLKGTHEYARLEMYAMFNILQNLPKMIRKQIFAKKGKVADDLTEEEKLRLECCSSKQILNEFVVPSKLIKIRPSNTITPPEVILPVDAFPEYKALEEKEKKSKCAIARVTSGDFLCGLPPPVITQKTKGIDAAHIHSCYTGYKKKMEHNQEKTKGMKECNGKWIKNVGWREALHLKYHGIYYNNNEQQEKFELQCDRLKEQVVRNETSSNCSTSEQLEMNCTYKPSKVTRALSKTDTKKITPVLRSSRRIFNDSDSCSGKSLTFIKNTSTLRRSPRKHAKDDKKKDLKPSDLLSEKLVKSNKVSSSLAIQRKAPIPADLSDVHKQKLRNVVLSALQSEGITMDHQIFKLCFKKLFTVCKPFALDVIGQGATTKNFERIAKSHVKQVVQFEKRKSSKTRI